MLERLLDDVFSSWESVGVECLPLLVETESRDFLVARVFQTANRGYRLAGGIEKFPSKIMDRRGGHITGVALAGSVRLYGV